MHFPCFFYVFLLNTFVKVIEGNFERVILGYFSVKLSVKSHLINNYENNKRFPMMMSMSLL